MGTTIWKYDLPVQDEVIEISMPVGASPLSVGSQFGDPSSVQLWASVDPDVEPAPLRFWIIGTGHPYPQTDKTLLFIGTVITSGGSLIWHVFGELN